MKTVVNRTMKHVITILVTILFLVSLQGCQGGEQKSQVEVTSPTGCLKSKGRYFDPKLKECVQVDNQHQARVLDSYRYVNQLAEEGKLEEARYRIVLKYMSIPKTQALWSYLKERGTEMEYFSASLPEGTDYEPNWGTPVVSNPKVWTGNMAPTCGWDYRFDEKPEEETIINFTENGIQALEAKYGKQLSERRKAIFEDGDCRVDRLSVIAKPEVVRDFWDLYLDDIEAIQPQVTFMDTAQPAIVPKPLVEGE